LGRLATAGALVVPLVVATACGSSSSKSSSSPGGTSAGKSGKALTIGLVMSVKGEDAYSVDDYYQGAQLAIEEINKAGGVNGKPINSFRVPAPSDPTALTDSVLKAKEKNPDIEVGFPPPALAALSRQVDSAGIPIIGTSSYAITNGKVAGSKWVFMTLDNDAETVRAAARYAVKGLNSKKIAVLHTNESFGTAGSEALKKDVPAEGGTIITDQGYAPTATDLTGPIVAAKGADAIVNWGYPGPMAAQVNAIANQGGNTPTVGAAGASLIVSSGIVSSPKAREQLYSTVPCNTQGDRPAQKAFLTAFKAKYGKVPGYVSAQVYDSVYLAVEAAKKDPSLSHDGLLKALETLSYTDGACATEYKADSTHTLVHAVTIVGFKGNGDQVTKATYDDLAG
jgi:branched-chain amino acid transport system substrate-binding protein